MHAETLSVPKAPRVPSDYVLLLTWCPKQSEVQRQRANVELAAEHGVECDGATCADELS